MDKITEQGSTDLVNTPTTFSALMTPHTGDLKVVEVDDLCGEFEEDSNPSDILAKYINIDVEPYQGTVINAQDVVNMYNTRNAIWAHMTGRKTTLTPEVFLKIIELKELYSFPDERIADAIGVHNGNLRKWKNRSRLSTDDQRYDPYFALFGWAYKRASTMLEKRLVGNIDKASDAKWEAARWLLSKIEQGRYGDQVKMDVESKNENTNTNLNLNVVLSENDKNSIAPMLESFISSPVVIDNDDL